MLPRTSPSSDRPSARHLVARYNKDTAWRARAEAFEKVSAHISGLLAGKLLTTAATSSRCIEPIRGRRDNEVVEFRVLTIVLLASDQLYTCHPPEPNTLILKLFH